MNVALKSAGRRQSMIYGLDPILTLLLGWLLGLLTPPITDRIRRPYRRKELQQALTAELLELRFTLAALVFRLRSHIGTLDHDVLRWLLPLHLEYGGPDAEPGQCDVIKRLIALSSAQLRALSPDRRTSGVGLALKTYTMPLLAAQVSNIGLLPLALQQRLLDVQAKVDLLNQQASQLIRAHEQTFTPGLTSENLTVLKANLGSGYQDMASRARRLADQVTLTLRECTPPS